MYLTQFKAISPLNYLAKIIWLKLFICLNCFIECGKASEEYSGYRKYNPAYVPKLETKPPIKRGRLQLAR